MKIPVYQQIERDLKEKIKCGSLPQGTMIPSENELKATYGVSRMTVRQALSNLVSEGFLYRHKGLGTFVSTVKIEKKIQGLQSFTEEMKAMNIEVKNQILTFKTIEADTYLSEKLFISEGEVLFLIERVRFGDQVPVLFERLFVPKKLFKDLSEMTFLGSFYTYVEKELHLKIKNSIQTIEAKEATAQIADILSISRNEPVLFITLNSFLDNGRAFEYVESYYRADKYRFIQQAMR